MGAELPAGVGLTAIMVAMGRMLESQRPDRLFEDPLAERFVRQAKLDGGPPRGEAVDYVAVRTRFFDDCLLKGAEDGIRQFVLLGAGLDTRAFGVLVIKKRSSVIKRRVQPGCRPLSTLRGVATLRSVNEGFMSAARDPGFVHMPRPVAGVCENPMTLVPVLIGRSELRRAPRTTCRHRAPRTAHHRCWYSTKPLEASR